MKIVIGLGNPGTEYERTRHNVGFQVLDVLARRHRLTFRPHRFRCLAARWSFAGHDVLLVKPLTYMNLSGEAVGPLVRFYKVPLSDILVVYDDLDLPLGALRMRPKGSSGGHKGVASIIEHLGSDAFPRLRIGIGRPPGKMDAADYVLSPFSPEEEALMEVVREEAADAVEMWIRWGTDKAMNWVNTRGRERAMAEPRGRE